MSETNFRCRLKVVQKNSRSKEMLLSLCFKLLNVRFNVTIFFITYFNTFKANNVVHEVHQSIL